ncbi:hypothetical protein [Kribbella ginsengisoli]
MRKMIRVKSVLAVMALAATTVLISPSTASAATWAGAGGCISRNGDVVQKVYLHNQCGRKYWVRATFTCPSSWLEYAWSYSGASSTIVASPYVSCWYLKLEWCAACTGKNAAAEMADSSLWKPLPQDPAATLAGAR